MRKYNNYKRKFMCQYILKLCINSKEQKCYYFIKGKNAVKNLQNNVMKRNIFVTRDNQ